MILGSNSVVSVYSLAIGAATDTYPATATLTGIEAYIESVKADMTMVLGQQGNLEVMDMYTEPISIKTGDKVVDQSGREYRVTGVERHENNIDTDNLYRITMNRQHV